MLGQLAPPDRYHGDVGRNCLASLLEGLHQQVDHALAEDYERAERWFLLEEGIERPLRPLHVGLHG